MLPSLGWLKVCLLEEKKSRKKLNKKISYGEKNREKNSRDKLPLLIVIYNKKKIIKRVPTI